VSTYLENCKLCALLQQEKNVTRIADFSTGIAFVNFDQTYPGRSMLVVRPHYDSLLDIPSQLTSPFMEDIKLLSRAIQAAFHPPLINLSNAGQYSATCALSRCATLSRCSTLETFTAASCSGRV
jgi:diadenosine tetraphosphate (Ap4A) HIT family hydrolase